MSPFSEQKTMNIIPQEESYSSTSKRVSLFFPGDRSSVFLQNVSGHLADYTSCLIPEGSVLHNHSHMILKSHRIYNIV